MVTRAEAFDGCALDLQRGSRRESDPVESGRAFNCQTPNDDDVGRACSYNNAIDAAASQHAG
jgi:hypothetical protein